MYVGDMGGSGGGGGGGSRGSRPRLLAHDVGFFTLVPKLDPPLKKSWICPWERTTTLPSSAWTGYTGDW